MLKTLCRDTDASVVASKSQIINQWSCRILVVNIVIAKSMIAALMEDATCCVTQVAVLLVVSQSQYPATAARNRKEYHAKLHHGQNLDVKTNVVSFSTALRTNAHRNATKAHVSHAQSKLNNHASVALNNILLNVGSRERVAARSATKLWIAANTNAKSDAMKVLVLHALTSLHA